LTHDAFELSRRCVDQLHVPQASAARPAAIAVSGP
jgi:hypothetical protein